MEFIAVVLPRNSHAYDQAVAELTDAFDQAERNSSETTFPDGVHSDRCRHSPLRNSLSIR
jgi:hypothetical protein